MLRAALGEPRKQLEHRVERPGARPRRDREIFLDRERGKNLALLRHPADAVAARAGAAAAREISCPRQSDAAGAQLRVAHDGEQQRRLADAVAAEHREAAVLRQFQRNAVQHHGVAIAGGHVCRSVSSGSAMFALAQIDFAHARVGGDLGRRAFGENRAADQHDDVAWRSGRPRACRAR